MPCGWRWEPRVDGHKHLNRELIFDSDLKKWEILLPNIISKRNGCMEGILQAKHGVCVLEEICDNQIMKYQSGSHSKYKLMYHLVWIPKYRKRVLQGRIAKRLEELFMQCAEMHE